MLNIELHGHNYNYEISELLKVFELTGGKICFSEPDETLGPLTYENDLIRSTLEFQQNKIIVITEGHFDGVSKRVEEFVEVTNNVHKDNKSAKLLVKRGFYAILKSQLKKEIPWGILTGIRPTKLVHEMLLDELRDEEIINNLEDQYFISKDKASLLLQVAKTEYTVLYPIDDNKISLYVSIPFCPTRCTYCSFPSNQMKKWGHLTEVYVNVLCEEIRETAKLDAIKTKVIDTVYIGGGTPSSLSHIEIDKVLNCIKDSFDLTNIREFTFEAGRPETITWEKLEIFKKNGVTRLSINPQTMNDCTLKHINRDHNSSDVISAYNMAKKAGFENINMDIIIGLPNENINMLKYTMEKIKEIKPLNITVHTLAIKKASNLKENNYNNNVVDNEITEMIELTMEYANSMGLHPYYLYRQKHMVGNLENIGYSKPGYEGIYNIQIMEEKQTIIALGAGAISKIIFNDENRLERVPNVKSLEHYLNRVDEMVERKRKALEGILC